METYIVCPNCKKTITQNAVVDSAAIDEGQGLANQYVTCDCGEKISYWQIEPSSEISKPLA